MYPHGHKINHGPGIIAAPRPTHDIPVPECSPITLCASLARLKGRRVVSHAPDASAGTDGAASPFAGWFS